MAALDANGKATLAKPTVYTINKDVPLEDKGIPLRFLLPMNRAGEYVVELKAMDNRTKKTSRVVLPFKVITISN